MPTNKELTTQVKALKGKLKELKQAFEGEMSKGSGDLGETPRIAVGLAKVDGKFKLVKILYNTDNNVSEIHSIEDADKNPLSPDLAMMNAKKVLMMEIFSKVIKEN